MSSYVPFADARTILLAGAVVAPSLIEWPNEPFAEPSADPGALFLSVECTGDVLEPIEMGGGGWQEEGTLYIRVLVPLNTGTDTARALAKTIANLYRGLPPRNVIYRCAAIGSPHEGGPRGMWYALTVSVDWIYQDVPA